MTRLQVKHLDPIGELQLARPVPLLHSCATSRGIAFAIGRPGAPLCKENTFSRFCLSKEIYDLLIERQLEQGSVSVAGPVHMADETVLPSQSMHCLVLDLLQSLTSPSHSPHALQSPNADK